MKTRTATILFGLLGAMTGACKGPGGEAAPAAPADSAKAAAASSAAASSSRTPSSAFRCSARPSSA